MPSQLINNEAISFVVVKPLRWYDHDYEPGDDFPQEDANNIETLIRSRWLIPVVDSIDDKPRHWHRHVMLREDALAKIHGDVVQINLDTGAESPQGVPATEADPEPPESLEETYDPAEHNVDAVLEYMDEHPEQRDEVLAMERAGRGRKGILEGY